MLAIAALIAFAAAVVVHGGVVVIHNHWFDATGLMLTGLALLAAHFIRGR